MTILGSLASGLHISGRADIDKNDGRASPPLRLASAPTPIRGQRALSPLPPTTPL
jgi:hypothetical protein